MGISYELLKKQNAETSNAIIEHMASNENFAKLSKFEGDSTVQRDKEDADKLQVGIDYAKEKGVIDKNYVPEPYVNLDVLGKTPDKVADEILEQVNKGGDSSSGSVIVLCGLSGTGKGTTVAKLRSKLEETGKEVVTWSNGNIFRSATLLAATWCEQQEGIEGFDKEKALTKENLASFIGMLSFGKNDDGQYDTHIQGLGLDLYVSKVQNTELKSAKVSKNIPTVAEVTQGEVILFAAKAVETLKNAGKMVLLEGREQTVNYVKTPHRFILMLSDESLIGKRRAAQRVMAGALEAVGGNAGADEAAVDAALTKTLDAMAADAK
ncbi:expressed unknown protein [Seminavis robusta]|uniref:SRP54-type proteins GTP-binding domain-containing protein n=1 Tax=Seminavis robusta TaxID=568900 RepID=A0A9N8EY96_9STRA|nr:expressed unknown protein [Seminavis robusta]|eukprot:Sro1962_g308090.1 n/a (323) ;mRNA; f:2413-3569